MSVYGFNASKEKVNIFNAIYPVGSIYMSVNNVNPGTLFGGTWVAWGTGRVPVGINTSDSSFDTVEKTGGSKNSIIPYHNHGFTGTQLGTHTHTGPSHSHTGGSLTGINVTKGYEEVLKTSTGNKVSALTSVSVGVSGYNNTGSSGTGNTGAASAGTPSGTVGYAGTSGNTTNANLQPYITCYMWKRTA